MTRPFIDHFEFFSIADYPGKIARCRFLSENYCDSLFSTLGITFPQHLVSAVTKRRAEFLAGRYAANQVLSHFGFSHFTLKRGKDRAPEWPQNIAGSLAHNIDTVLCAAHHKHDLDGVGIDIELQLSPEKAAELWPSIISKEEYDSFQQQSYPFEQLLTLAFSAKESVFKALYPKVLHYFDFLEVKISKINVTEHTFECVLVNPLSIDYQAGCRFHGHFLFDNHNVITFIFFNHHQH